MLFRDTVLKIIIICFFKSYKYMIIHNTFHLKNDNKFQNMIMNELSNDEEGIFICHFKTI